MFYKICDADTTTIPPIQSKRSTDSAVLLLYILGPPCKSWILINMTDPVSADSDNTALAMCSELELYNGFLCTVTNHSFP